MEVSAPLFLLASLLCYFLCVQPFLHKLFRKLSPSVFSSSFAFYPRVAWQGRVMGAVLRCLVGVGRNEGMGVRVRRSWSHCRARARTSCSGLWLDAPAIQPFPSTRRQCQGWLGIDPEQGPYRWERGANLRSLRRDLWGSWGWALDPDPFSDYLVQGLWAFLWQLSEVPLPPSCPRASSTQAHRGSCQEPHQIPQDGHLAFSVT